MKARVGNSTSRRSMMGRRGEGLRSPAADISAGSAGVSVRYVVTLGGGKAGGGGRDVAIEVYNHGDMMPCWGAIDC